MVEQISHNSIFAFVPDIEPLFSALNVLINGANNSALSALYSEQQIKSYKQKYKYLFEAYKVVRIRNPLWLLDIILDISLQDFHFEGIRRKILSLPEEDLIWTLLDLERTEDSNKDTLIKALVDDAAVEEVYRWIESECESFLILRSLIRESKRIVNEFLALASDMYTADLEHKLKNLSNEVLHIRDNVQNGVDKLGPLEYSQEQMGKVFRNAGPYDEYIFVSTYCLPSSACRVFHREGICKRQILFLNLRNSQYFQRNTLSILKAMADSTRYKILSLLAQEGSMRGIDIAKSVSIATSTVSHHMDQLKECGLITEEQVKNSKYYGINRNAVIRFLTEINNDFQGEL